LRGFRHKGRNRAPPPEHFAFVGAYRRVQSLAMSLTHPLTTTTFELPGYRVIKSFGVVRGIIVRSRSIVGNFGASIQAIFGGNISLYTNLCERTREDAFNRMLTHAGELGANAVIGVRYDATELRRASPRCCVTAQQFMWRRRVDS
jgi:uncharacterized protein YbjQ (UPF0145 family)